MKFSFNCSLILKNTIVFEIERKIELVSDLLHRTEESLSCLHAFSINENDIFHQDEGDLN
jgi:hypothetical protein